MAVLREIKILRQLRFHVKQPHPNIITLRDIVLHRQQGMTFIVELLFHISTHLFVMKPHTLAMMVMVANMNARSAHSYKTAFTCKKKMGEMLENTICLVMDYMDVDLNLLLEHTGREIPKRVSKCYLHQVRRFITVLLLCIGLGQAQFHNS